VVEYHKNVEQCDSGSGSGAIVGGGKRTKTQSQSKSVAPRHRGKQQSAGMIDKQKFYGGDQLTRPPLASHSCRHARPRNRQLCKMVFLWSAPDIQILVLSFLFSPYELKCA